MFRRMMVIACLSLICGCGGGNQLPVTEVKDASPGVLTRERAQRTLDAWQADDPNTSVKIERSVVEYLAFSTAEAEVAITNVRYKDGEIIKSFSGKGKAGFKKYTDHWRLESVECSLTSGKITLDGKGTEVK